MDDRFKTPDEWKSKPQLAQWHGVSSGARPEVVYVLLGDYDWRSSISGEVIPDPENCTFLCLTPVTPE